MELKAMCLLRFESRNAEGFNLKLHDAIRCKDFTLLGPKKRATHEQNEVRLIFNQVKFGSDSV